VKDPDFKKLSQALAEAYRKEASEADPGPGAKTAAPPKLPSRDSVERIRALFFQVLFPGVFCEEGLSGKLRSRTHRRLVSLQKQLAAAVHRLAVDGGGKKRSSRSREK
jgi:hypothetical protein